MKTTNQSIPKKIVKLALLLLVVITFSCDQDSDIDPMTDNALAKKSNAKKQVTRPISNKLYSYPNPDDNGATTVFFGTVTHMGKVSGIVTTTLFDTVTDPANWLVESEDVINAANGDKLFTIGSITIHAGDAIDGIAPVTGGSEITGGTGRFEGATGYFVYSNMIIDLTTFEESHTSEGEITY